MLNTSSHKSHKETGKAEFLNSGNPVFSMQLVLVEFQLNLNISYRRAASLIFL